MMFAPGKKMAFKVCRNCMVACPDNIPQFKYNKVFGQIFKCQMCNQASGDAPRHVTIIGLAPHSLENKLGLSVEAEAGLGKMVDMLVRELRDLGIDLQERARPLQGYWAGQADLERAGECA